MEKAETVVDVENEIVEDVEDERLSESIQRKLNTLCGNLNETENFTIFRVPDNYKIPQSKKHLFEPSVLSIGPFHRGKKKSLRALEEQKWRFLRNFLSRGGHNSLDLCITQMKLLEERARKCYSEMVDLDSNGFVEMMLLDGCFLLEYFKGHPEKPFNVISEIGCNAKFVHSDLLLLENQIPFFVVEKLCEIGLEDRINFVNNIIIRFMATGPTYHPLIPNPPAQIHNLVHLYHHCSVPNPSAKPAVLRSKSFHLTIMLSSNKIKNFVLGFHSWVLRRKFPGSTSPSLSLAFPNSTGNRSVFIIPCATELQDAGMKFRPKSNPQHMLDVSFDHGVLEIPKVTIGSGCKPLLANLIAFEQCKLGEMHANYLTLFAMLMDRLVNTQKDVIILHQCGIIDNCLSDEEELTHFLNQLGKDLIVPEDHFLAELFSELNRYRESSWNRQRAKLVRDYFSSPWAAISLVAALVLLVLTCVQSFFAVYAYYVSPS